MTDKRHFILELARQGCIAQEDIGKAIELCADQPDKQTWHVFITRLCLWAGCTSIAVGVVFFIAANWADMGRFAKFALLEACVVMPVLIFLRYKHQHIVAKACLLFSSIMVGALLAFYGQTYQTGADPWQLFFYWALLITPWVIIAIFPALTMLWIVLINISLSLYIDVHHQIELITLALVFFILNTVLLISWEYLAKRVSTYKVRWAPRCLAIASGTLITAIATNSIIDFSVDYITYLIIYPIWLIGVYAAYRWKQKDMFILAGASLSIIIITSVLLVRVLLDILDMTLFVSPIIAVCVMLMTAKLVHLLKKINAEVLP